ncbi:alpha/beta hydrolase [Saccharicrinis sp. FJH62]|uniref:alpha/beta hydrolase n=1 Tax=Saccharicrinis sp. FJH62 TaxID=3344657 RepID=UPI0035D4A1DF
MKKVAILTLIILMFTGIMYSQNDGPLKLAQGDDIYLTKPLNPELSLTPVQYKNRFGISIAAHLYLRKDFDKSKKHPAILIGAPYGGVKEQGPTVYAQEMALRGFVALTFDESFNGESGGDVKDLSSPEVFVEDFSAGVDYLGTRDFVDRDKIGVIGICGSGGFALTAAQADPRIKAVATASMYDISDWIRNGIDGSTTARDREKTKERLAKQRWEDFEKGEPKMPGMGWPKKPAQKAPGILPPVMKEFYEYYGTERGWHPNTLDNFTLTSALSFMTFPLISHIEEISPRPVLIIVGENAHSINWSKKAYESAAQPKELVIIPEANHIDLYDGGDKNYIPFEKLESFFKESLK